jgi:large subunit ribosomal protein L24
MVTEVTKPLRDENMPQHVQKGDLVSVIAGPERGKTGKVLRVVTKTQKVVVEGLHLARKHIKPNQKNPQGGVLEREMPMAISNVLPVVDGKATRVRFVTQADGSKQRIAVKGGQAIGQSLRGPSK